jgi:hypothetical protein
MAVMTLVTDVVQVIIVPAPVDIEPSVVGSPQ